MTFTSHKFRCRIVRASTGSPQSVLWTLLNSGHSEIGNFDLTVARQEDILGLQISMANVERMAVVQSADYLPEIVDGLILWNCSDDVDVPEKIALLDIFENQVTESRGVSPYA
jgi:hypothetical protein